MKETIFLYNKTGHTEIYENKDEAYKTLGFTFIAHTVAVHIGDIDNTYFRNMDIHPKRAELIKMNQYATQKKVGDFVLRNEYDDILTISDFDVQINQNKKAERPRYGMLFWNGIGAVPGTGKRKSYSRWFRAPRTTAAIRSSMSVIKDEGETEFRPSRRRGYCTLPTVWDDIDNNSYGNRNWKGFRKTQWK